MRIKYSVRFDLHVRDPKIPPAIRMRLSYNGSRIDIPVGYRILGTAWDAAKEKVKAGASSLDGIKSSSAINRTLDEFRTAVGEAFARYEIIEKRKPSIPEIKALILDLLGIETLLDKATDSLSLEKAFNRFIELSVTKNGWAPATLTKYRQTRALLLGYTPKATLQDVDSHYLTGFVQSLIAKGYANSSIAKGIRLVKTFLRWASAEALYNGDAHNDFKIKLRGAFEKVSEIIYLTKDELAAVESFKGNTALEKVRDLFVFCCYTGLRYSDAIKLRISDIKPDYISVVTKKTSLALRIELNTHSSRIIEQYRPLRESENSLLFSPISNQKANDYIKEICRQCHINTPTRTVMFRGSKREETVSPKWELVTSHCARRTFVVNALRLGIPAEVIMRWTGHSSFAAMKPYIAIVDELKKQEMSKFNS